VYLDRGTGIVFDIIFMHLTTLLTDHFLLSSSQTSKLPSQP
jgi:hypothetical protein